MAGAIQPNHPGEIEKKGESKCSKEKTEEINCFFKIQEKTHAKRFKGFYESRRECGLHE